VGFLYLVGNVAISSLQAEDIQPVQARAERLLVNRQHSSNRRMAEDLEVTSNLSTVEDTQAVLVRAERLLVNRQPFLKPNKAIRMSLPVGAAGSIPL
tara:strand:+ start:96 stop:386 length:291 start_codon:yes stop_codon:yes gene_type:complete